jgi:hypothetical protein
METAFDIRRSNKNGIDSQEHYVVTKGGIVFLRVIRDEQQQYYLVTATAGEDTGQFHPYPDKNALCKRRSGHRRCWKRNLAGNSTT